MDDVQAQQLAKREALFRATNEEIARVDGDFSGEGENLEIVCECARDGCSALITVSHFEYTQARGEPRRFLLVPGHELSELERVVSRHDGFVVVEKEAPGAVTLVEETDPRT